MSTRLYNEYGACPCHDPVTPAFLIREAVDTCVKRIAEIVEHYEADISDTRLHAMQCLDAGLCELTIRVAVDKRKASQPPPREFLPILGGRVEYPELMGNRGSASYSPFDDPPEEHESFTP